MTSAQPAFDYDIYVSYDEIDLDWVKQFLSALSGHLSDVLGRPPAITEVEKSTRAKQRVWKGQELEASSEVSFLRSRVWLIIVSADFFERFENQAELKVFLRQIRQGAGASVPRFFKVVREPEHGGPKELELVQGYNFFHYDRQKRPIPLTSDSDPEEYERRIAALAEDIAVAFPHLERETQPSETPVEEPPEPEEEIEANEPATEQPAPNAADPGPPVAGYISDTVDPHAEDRLGFTREVEAICRVLTSCDVHPPLSLGLFGDWGSGKSFFMAKMREEIKDIAHTVQLIPKGQKTHFYRRIVQVEFNAWHFADANLWASLVTNIFETLFDDLTGKAEAEERTKKELELRQKLAEELAEQATRELREAEIEVRNAEEALHEAEEARQHKEDTFFEKFQDLRNLLAGDEKVRDKVAEATDALGIPQATASYEALEATAKDLHTFSQRAAAVGHLVLRKPFGVTGITFLLVALVLLPFVVPYLLEVMQVQIGTIAARIAEISAFIGTGVAWVGLQFKRINPYLSKIEDGLEKARQVREARLATITEDEKQTLAEARQREVVARDLLLEAQRKLEQVKQERRDFNPSRRMYRLIEERSRDGQYSKHLGIISLIRKDFEQLGRLLSAVTAGTDAEGDEDDSPAVERIILYIDDLDRCRPERVVEVLEAVHLLLAFPLFVVVVAVDPRWLRRCLARHYRDVLTMGGNRAHARSPEASVLRSSTPQDYLEKIFQIPIALRPIEPQGFRDLMEDLLPSATVPGVAATQENDSGPTLPADAETLTEAMPATQPTPTKRDAQALAGVPGDEGGAASPAEPSAQDEAPEPSSQESSSRRRRVRLNAQQLVFTAQERADIERMAPLFRTPRSVKRFVNIYRLIRVGLADDEVAAFEGTPETPGEYRVVLMLLAVVTGFPNIAPRFLGRLTRWIPLPDDPEARSPWDAFLETLHLPLEDVEAIVQEETADTGPSLERQSSDTQAWQRLGRALKEMADAEPETPFLPFSEDVLTKWVGRVARYSFSFNLRDG